MSWLDRVFRRRRMYDDLAAEIQSHLDERTDALMATGMPADAARQAARRAFGNPTYLAESGRELWAWPVLDSVLRDVKYALRQLRRAPIVPLIIVATLGIGIAATATVFSWARSVLLDPLPGVADASRVWALESRTASGTWTPTSWLDYRDFCKYLKSFDGLAAAYPSSFAVGDAAHAERVPGELVSGNFFDVLRVRPALGHFFAASLDDGEGGDPAVVLGYSYWKSHLNGDSAVIGKVLRVNRFPFTVIGVAPKGFHGSLPGEEIGLWVPAAMLGQIVPTGSWWLRDRGDRTFRVLARIKDDVSPHAAAAEVQTFGSLMGHVNLDVSKGMSARLMPVWQSHWGVQDALRTPITILLAACGLVLLIVCANTANLLLARSTGRRRELALRMALGAARIRLLRQLLTEASVLAIAGSAIGLGGAFWLARSLRWLMPSFAAPALVAPHVDAHVVALVALLAIGVTVIAGIAPALHGSREAHGEALNEGGRANIGGTGTAQARGVLVAVEMALAVVALVGAGLFYQSFQHMRGVPAGFDAAPVAMGTVSVTLAGYDSARGDAFLENVAGWLRGQPSVQAATYADYVPLSLGDGSWEDLRVEGYAPSPSENMKVHRAAIGPDYFKTLGIPLVQGRDFTTGDDSVHAAVMIVNEAFVRQYLPGRAVLGVRVHGWGRWFTIVGVAKDSKVYRLTEPPAPYFYVPVRQVYRPEYGYTFLVKTSGSTDDAVRAIGAAVRAEDPTVPVYDAMPMMDYVQTPMREQRAAVELLGGLAAIAALLAAIGLYGVMAHLVTQRTKEIGIRVALGARPAHIMRSMAARSGTLAGVGLVAGLLASVGLARLVSSLLFAMSRGEVAIFAGAAAAMLGVAFVATLVPALRALRVDPLTALRAD